MSSENLAESILRRRAANLPAADLADVLDSLVWVLKDNGAEINEARRRWIDSEDPYAAELAIQMNESIPYEPAVMLRKLDELEMRFPHLAPRCQELRQRVASYLAAR